MKKIFSFFMLALISAGMVLAQEGEIVTGGEEITVSLPTDVQKRIEIASDNVNLVRDWAEPTRTQVVMREVRIVEKYLVNRNIVKKQSISDEEIRLRLKKIGYSAGGPATWGASEVLYCLRGGLMVGMKPGATPSSKEWKTSATREQLATVAARESRSRQAADADEARERQQADQAEARARQLADDTEKRAREEGDLALAIGFLFFALITGGGFLLRESVRSRG